MNSNEYKDYPDITHISKSQLDPNTSHSKMLTLVGQNKRVVDFGCATGYFAKLLVEEGCQVVGVEINPEAAREAKQHCEKVIAANLDCENIEDILKGEHFDVAVFGDVLEHLKDPWKVLKSVSKVLNPKGYVVASIPNIAHGSIRLALLEGDFEYTELGLLDNTHLRFFTHNSVHKLFEETGFCIEAESFTTLPVFNESPLTPSLEKSRFPIEILEYLNKDENSEVLQFVIRAFPRSVSDEYNVLRQNYYQLQSHAELLKTEFQRTQIELQRSQAELQRSQAELSHLEQVIQTMESTIFWKVRKAYLSVKKVIIKA